MRKTFQLAIACSYVPAFGFRALTCEAVVIGFDGEDMPSPQNNDTESDTNQCRYMRYGVILLDT